MFKFNFNNFENDQDIKQSDIASKNEKQNAIEQHNYASKENAPEIKIEYGIFTYDELNTSFKKSFAKNEISFKNFLLCDNSEDKITPSLDYVDAYRLEIDENDSLSKINKTHDLVAGQYEGGLKVFNELHFSKLLIRILLQNKKEPYFITRRKIFISHGLFSSTHCTLYHIIW
jgi:hypothetical protein